MRQSELNRPETQRGMAPVSIMITLVIVFLVLGVLNHATHAAMRIATAIAASVGNLPHQNSSHTAVICGVWLIAVTGAAAAMFCTRP